MHKSQKGPWHDRDHSLTFRSAIPLPSARTTVWVIAVVCPDIPTGDLCWLSIYQRLWLE